MPEKTTYDSGRSLTPEEIEQIKHTIRPIERIRNHTFGKVIYIDADTELNNTIYKRMETIDK